MKLQKLCKNSQLFNLVKTSQAYQETQGNLMNQQEGVTRRQENRIGLRIYRGLITVL